MRVRVDTDYVLGLLLEKEQFDLARKYAGIVGSTASEVTIKEVGRRYLLICIITVFTALSIAYPPLLARYCSVSIV